MIAFVVGFTAGFLVALSPLARERVSTAAKAVFSLIWSGAKK